MSTVEESNLRTARAIMRSGVFTLRPEDPALVAIAELMARDLAGAPVVGPDGAFLGLLTEHDCIRLLEEIAFSGGESPSVAELMTVDAPTVAPDDHVRRVAAVFEANGVRRLPVVEDGALVGLVTRHELLEALWEATGRRDEFFRDESKRFEYGDWRDVPGFGRHPPGENQE